MTPTTPIRDQLQTIEDAVDTLAAMIKTDSSPIRRAYYAEALTRLQVIILEEETP
jgi:hypothetical protein